MMDKEKEEAKEIEDKEPVAAVDDNNDDNEAYYKGIIEQQSKTIESQNERIDKLISQMQGLVNNHGNYKEEPRQEYKPIEQAPKPAEYEPLSSLDFSI